MSLDFSCIPGFFSPFSLHPSTSHNTFLYAWWKQISTSSGGITMHHCVHGWKYTRATTQGSTMSLPSKPHKPHIVRSWSSVSDKGPPLRRRKKNPLRQCFRKWSNAKWNCSTRKVLSGRAYRCQLSAGDFTSDSDCKIIHWSILRWHDICRDFVLHCDFYIFQRHGFLLSNAWIEMFLNTKSY